MYYYPPDRKGVKNTLKTLLLNLQKCYGSNSKFSTETKPMKNFVGTDSESCHGYMLNLLFIAAVANDTSSFSKLTTDEDFATFLPHFSDIHNFCIKTFIYEVADNTLVKYLMKPTDTARVADEEDLYIFSNGNCNICDSAIGKMNKLFPIPDKDGAESFHDGEKYTNISFLELAIRSVFHFKGHPTNLIPLIPDEQKLSQMINKYNTETDDNNDKNNPDYLSIKSREKNLYGMLLPTPVGEHLVLVVMNRDDVQNSKNRIKAPNQSSIYDSAIKNNITARTMPSKSNQAEDRSHKMCMKHMISCMDPYRGYWLFYRKSLVHQSVEENSCGLTASLLMMYIMNDIGGNNDKTVKDFHKEDYKKYHNVLASFFLKAILFFVEETHTQSTKDMENPILLKDDNRFKELAKYVNSKFTNDVTNDVASIPENIKKCFSFLLNEEPDIYVDNRGEFSGFVYL